MDERLKHRLVGAAVLVSLAVIFLPMLLNNAGESGPTITSTNIPPKPKNGFSSRVMPVEEPQPRVAAVTAPQAAAEKQGAKATGPAPATGPPASSGSTATAATASASAAAGSRVTTASGTPAKEAAKAAVAPGAGTAEKHVASTREGVSPLAPGVTAWAVQLGSFAKPDNATALRDKLRHMGYTAFVERVPGVGGTMTRVFVGPELERGNAVKTQEKLRAETKLDGIVVRYPGG